MGLSSLRNCACSFALLTLAAGSLSSYAAKHQPDPVRAVVGEAVEYELSADLSLATRNGDKFVWTKSIAHPGATFVKAHFFNFNLRPGDALHLVNDKGRVVETLRGQGPKSRINFWGLSAQGEGLTLRFEYAQPYDKLPFGIDKLMLGTSTLFASGSDGDDRSICAPADFEDAICVQSDPGKWSNAQASVGVMSVGGNAETAMYCSGSNVSPANAILTNEHCVATQLECDDTEYVFNYYRTGCNIGAPTTQDWQSFRCDELLVSEPLGDCDATFGTLDFALTTVMGDPASTFGYTELDDDPLTSGEEIYILQHPDGRPLEITQGSGADVVVDGTVLRYYNTLDTEGGSSGSSIYRASNNKIVGLHHCGGCNSAGIGNRGMLITDIAPQIEPFICTAEPELKFNDSTAPTEVVGNGNALIEPGESWSFSVELRNRSCSSAVNDVVAQIELNSAVTDAIEIVDPALAFGTIDAGMSGLSSPVTINIPTDASCGNLIDFDVTSITADGLGGFNDELNAVSLSIGDIPESILYSTDFDGGIGAWSVVDGGTGGGSASTWTDANPGNRTIPLIAPFMIIDSDAAGSGVTQDDELLSPTLNIANMDNARIQFTHDFNYFNGSTSEQADVDVRSVVTGGEWVTIANFSGSNASGVVSLDVTPYRAIDFQIRFRYHNASYEWWWAIDDVFVIGDNGFECEVFTGISDADSDGIADANDNCTLAANPTQLDVDEDGYGNMCDPDFNNDNVVNFADISAFSNVFNTTDALADLNGDGAVNFLDFAIVAGYFLSPPGPSGLAP